MEKKPFDQRLSIALDFETLKAIKEQAASLGVTPGTLGRMLITKSMPAKEDGK